MHLSEAYSELELEPGASAEAVKQARNILLKVWHPDRHQQDAKVRLAAEKKTVRINEAYRVIEQAGFPPAENVKESDRDSDSVAAREYELRMRELDLREREVAAKEREAAKPTTPEWIEQKARAAGDGLSHVIYYCAIIFCIIIGAVVIAEIMSPGSTR
jgi:hypothetical protein